ncbi:hypothetical protein OPV22_025703 [Ensete ventricosum]|uniref:glucan endo-1,3-beta-D-glucosidase n=1 Tax=Ensete ventricosum TaxID=4639 RepID=A0AAV8P8F1_ENSVE|nr:hypothetical protein OPV22_025703 [Ensete ventricosum]
MCLCGDDFSPKELIPWVALCKHPLPTVVTHGISSDALVAILVAVSLLVFVLVLVCPPSPSLPLAKKRKMSNSRLPLFFCCLFFFLLPRHVLLKVDAFTGTYGINYGRIADNLPPPESVVTLLKAARIKNVRIFDSDHSVIKAFKGSGIELTVAIPNEHLTDISVYEDHAMSWVKENVQPFLPGTRIRGIAVGNEVLGGTDQELAQVLLGAIKNVYNALDRLQLSHEIEVSTPHSEGVFVNSFPPSSCTFKEDVLVLMKPILDFFSQIGSPLYINAYPFISYKNDPEHIDINYALFQSNAGIHDAKTDLHYDNMFDAKIDAAYTALEAAGYGKMAVRVSETGWASAGDANEAGATLHNARTYNYNLRKRLFKKKGTPLRPKMVVQAYVFALFNENLKIGPSSEKHYGLFKADGSISYDIGLTGLKPSSASPSLLSLNAMVFWVVSLLLFYIPLFGN